MKLSALLAFVATVSAAAIPAEVLTERQACPLATASQLSAAKTAFQQAKLVPASTGLIDNFNPTLAVSAAYGTKQVQLGNTFAATETLSEPSVSFTAEPGFDPAKTKYTIFLLDPDPPDPAAPILKDFLHLEIANAQPSCITSQSRQTVASYMALTPLSVAAHRYTFLVYRQPPNYAPPPKLENLPAARSGFNLNAYTKTSGLIGPVGGNFFREGLGTTV
ncbi:phosphatidylethanolamine-binding-like protein [Polychaeton citri CBS 116435]|uniref:Phosphatidylethanolamine-binding-like protein n=1 Tax=Polychaeton citri CBS 116435 TaxID=1314669 RepID=A0A9P4UV85_9PEZI|nr:phosphatidylethanolamine-binding-like protein [Polychaeton citri CBS 116435]